MDEQDPNICTAFDGNRCIASGKLLEVAKKVKKIIGRDEQTPILIFNDLTSDLIDVDFRGTMEDVLKRLEKPATRALFAGNPDRFNDLIASWPVDIRDHARMLANAAFQSRV